MGMFDGVLLASDYDGTLRGAIPCGCWKGISRPSAAFGGGGGALW